MAGEGKRNRTRGFQFEREVVNKAKEAGLEAERCWGSDGASKGLPSNVDVIIQDKHYQCKRMKRLSTRIKPDDNIHAQIVRANREEAFVVLRLSDYLELIKTA